ncbi:NBS-containing resistance-like protein [Trifolium pratense]|uniref:NBS-containing resistance-like protein n=1 Tax=Trifolium pratense TaxID=57577 RepID=A0A2K3L6S4_TRIPR|nr:NBS-containing resistance-like protein [Trifolium pratense]PNX75757.1 NBS-containing resistance-like protein [Trifolium pratense]PNY09048.1 NBS-containing resistance-like protein [Trifolium pratense]
MAETAVSLALEEVFQLLKEETNFLRDVIDEYLRLTYEVKDPGCGRLVCKIASLIKTLTPRHRIASEIQDIKMSIRGIKERSERYNFQISQAPGSSSINNTTRETENRRWRDPRLSFLFIEETAIVGLEGPREELTGWLLSGASERTCIAVVGMGGIGKTTLAKLVFDSQKVTTQFDCRACITVSQSSTVRGLLINMMEEFCGETENPLMQMLHKMDDKSLITQVRKYLQHKKYLIFTTRIMQVADFFKKSFLVHVHNLQLLSPNKAWELFCKKAFRFEHDGHCPPELKSLSKEIVRKCKQLPLA